MSDNTNTSNSNPNWKSYTETNDKDDIITATDFNDEFAIKVDQSGGYSINQNLVNCNIDATSTLNSGSTALTIASLLTFYNSFKIVSSAWNPILKTTTSSNTSASYTSVGEYVSFTGMAVYWGVINCSNLGVLNGIISEGTQTLNVINSQTDVAQSNISATNGSGSGAIFDVSSKDTWLTTAITMASNGENYKVNDVITIGNGGTGNVTSVTVGGEIVQISYETTNTPTTTQPSATNTTITGGSGSGATFSYTSTSSTMYLPDTVAINNAGTGYAVGDTLDLNNVGTVTVSTIGTGGTIETFTTALITAPVSADMAANSVSGTTSGSGVNATFTVTSNSNTYYTLSTITIDDPGKDYIALDSLVVEIGTTKLATITVSSVSLAGSIVNINYSLNTNYLDTNPAGNNITGTGGSGTLATFDITASQYFSYDTLTIVNGGQNYKVNDLLTVGTVGTYKVTDVITESGTIQITGLPSAQSDLLLSTNVDYFNGYDGGNLILSSENGSINFYVDQKQTSLSTSEINSSFILNFSGWYVLAQ